MSKVIGCALDFLLDVLDYSPEEATLPTNYETLVNQLSADPLLKEYWAIVLWNDEKHSYDEAVAHLQHMTGCNLQQATAVVMRTDEEVCSLALCYWNAKLMDFCRAEMSSKSQVMPIDC